MEPAPTRAEVEGSRPPRGRMFFRKRKRKLASSAAGQPLRATNRRLCDRHQQQLNKCPPKTTSYTRLSYAAMLALAAAALAAAPAAQSSAPEALALANNLTESSVGQAAERLAAADSQQYGAGEGKGGGPPSARRAEAPLLAAGRPARSLSKGDSSRLVAVSGQSIEFQCPLANELLAVANSGAPSNQPDHLIVWRKNGTRLNQLEPRVKANEANGSLLIVGAQPRLDEAVYECGLVQRAKQDDPIKAHRFHLRLVVPPRLAPFEFPADAQVGMRLVLTCSVLEGQQPVSFVWLKDGQIVGGPELGQRPSSAHSLGHLHQQQLADKAALLSPAERSEYVVLGAKLDDQEPQQQPMPLLSDGNIRLRQADDYSMLTIDKLELKHSGRYTCSAQNEAARAQHSSQLVINAPPSLTVEPKDGDLVSGQSTVIDCAASGQPRAVISWLRARESQNNKLWDYVPVYDNLRYTTLPNGSLAIDNATQREQGYYLCSAKNGFGPEVTKLIKITVHEPAKFGSKYKTVEVRIDERANMLCMAAGELPIRIEWLDKEGRLIDKNDKRFIIDDEPTDVDQKANEPPNGTVSRLILARSGRSDSGHYTCQASNRHGSDKMVTNLLVQDVPDKVTELKVTNVTASTVSIRWQLAFSGNAPVTSYLVQYQSDDPLDDLLPSPPRNQPSSGAPAPLEELLPGQSAAGPTNAASSLRAALDALNVASSLESADEVIDRTLVELTVEQSSTHLVVKDLSPYCVYRLRLAGINKLGLGEFSDWIRAKTEEAPPSGSALKMAAAATGPNSIKLSWSPPDRRSWNGQLVAFNIGYRPIDSSFELNKTVEWTPPSLHSLMLDAQADKQLKSSERPDAALEPPAAANRTSSGPAGVRTSSNTNNSASHKSLLRQHLRQLLALQQQELVAHLTNLQRSTTYLVWIQALNSRGLGPKSHAISIKTLDDVPPSAPAIKVQSASASSITVAWSMLSNFVSSANQYSLFYRRLAQPLATAGSAQQRQQAAGAGSGANSSGPLELQLLLAGEPAGHFIERTINSQQLMMSGNMFLGADTMLEPSQEQLLLQVKPSFMHQQAQHYQQFVYTLDQLECGSVYEMYMITRNSVGKSEPSALVTTRTLGEPPLAPSNKNNVFSKIGLNDISLNLASWSTGGCPITHITVRYRQAHTPSSTASSGNGSSSLPAGPTSNQSAFGWPITTSVPTSVLANLNGQLPRSYSAGGALLQRGELPHTQPPATPFYALKNLLPNTCYELEIIAYNAAGHTAAQYEFVTSNLNGSRSGFGRKSEGGVFRIEQRGASNEQQSDAAPASIEQQQISFSNQAGSGAQIVPILLLCLCLVCLIVSFTFCYYRLADSWKRHRRSSTDTTGAAGSSRASHCPAASGSSPGAIGKSSMWRINNQFSAGHSAATLKQRHHHAQHRLAEPEQDSPTALHYCMREPAGGQLMEPKSAGSFGQSVSMKDFNLIQSGSHAAAASTLNLKNYRNSVRPIADEKGGTLRARAPLNGVLSNHDDGASGPSCTSNAAGTAAHQHHQMCSALYAATCKQKQEQDPAYLATASQRHFSNGSSQYGNHCSYSSTDGQQQETSWTNCNSSNCTAKHGQTTYAIPSANFGDQINQGLYDAGQLDYHQHDGGVYGQNGIEACIQQLITNHHQQQQYQEQEQPQQYAMIVNQKLDPSRCALYGNEGLNYASMQANVHPAAMQSKMANLSTNCRQSVIDSSSSSSGIDIGAHLDCASTVTGSSNSNTSNNGYHLTSCERQNFLNERLSLSVSQQQQPQLQQQQSQQQKQTANEVDLKQV